MFESDHDLWDDYQEPFMGEDYNIFEENQVAEDQEYTEEDAYQDWLLDQEEERYKENGS